MAGQGCNDRCRLDGLDAIFIRLDEDEIRVTYYDAHATLYLLVQEPFAACESYPSAGLELRLVVADFFLASRWFYSQRSEC